MAARIQTNITDKASTNTTFAGASLTNELANQAFPESSSKRWTFGVRNLNGTAGTGSTPLEIFIDGVFNFRIKVADTSTIMVEGTICYTASGAATSAVHTIRLAMMNRAGTTTILADSTNTKMPIAATSSVTPSVISSELLLTCAGAVGDTNGRWRGRLTVTEVTDLG